MPPSLTALGEGSHGSILNGNYAPNRLSSAWKPTPKLKTGIQFDSASIQCSYGILLVYQADARAMQNEEDTLTQSAFEEIRRMIVSGEMPGGAVVTERGLGERLGRSRTPIRAAIGRLEGEGYLRRHGRVILVEGVAVEDIIEILNVRLFLEVGAAREAAGRMSKETVTAIRNAILDMRDPSGVVPALHWSVDDLIHLSIAEASGNKLLARMVVELRDRTRMFGLSRIPSRFEAGKEEHLAIIDAIEAGDGQAAAEAMSRHLENARAGIVQALSKGRL
ncbi:GntR family transcriptional regulator [Shinella sp. HY16]|uniref:GntR family transcriptional regulator n=1 Tax=Shinella sp. HY16 TaxID=2862956 RepID=UPI00234F30BA|nr:GntR family transcriptional regulator [Shinella sp. HY16]MDC7271244.1 GntR family transcriptional regulator [Shinella sp. YZ44]